MRTETGCGRSAPESATTASEREYEERIAKMLDEEHQRFRAEISEFLGGLPAQPLKAEDYFLIGEMLWQAGFATTDEPPRGKGYGYYERIGAEDVHALIEAARRLPLEMRQRIARGILA